VSVIEPSGAVKHRNG